MIPLETGQLCHGVIDYPLYALPTYTFDITVYVPSMILSIAQAHDVGLKSYLHQGILPA